jgi:hypothetical protein
MIFILPAGVRWAEEKKLRIARVLDDLFIFHAREK